MSTSINTNSPAPAQASFGSQPPLGTTDQTPGTGILQLARALAAGISAQSIACAELSKNLNTYSEHTVAYAKDAVAIGNQMAAVGEKIIIIQWVLTGLLVAASLGTFAAAAAPLIMAGGVTSAEAATAKAVVSVATQGIQTAGSLVQGGLLGYKGYLTMENQQLSSSTQTLNKTIENDMNAIKSGFDGATKNSKDVNDMLLNDGRIMKQRITR